MCNQRFKTKEKLQIKPIAPLNVAMADAADAAIPFLPPPATFPQAPM